MDEILAANLALLGYLMPLSLIVAALLTLLTRSVDLAFQAGRTAAVGAFLLSVVLGIAVFTSVTWSAQLLAWVKRVYHYA